MAAYIYSLQLEKITFGNVGGRGETQKFKDHTDVLKGSLWTPPWFFVVGTHRGTEEQIDFSDNFSDIPVFV